MNNTNIKVREITLEEGNVLYFLLGEPEKVGKIPFLKDFELRLRVDDIFEIVTK